MGNCLYTRSGHRMVQKPCTDRDNYSIRLYKDPDLYSGIKRSIVSIVICIWQLRTEEGEGSAKKSIITATNDPIWHRHRISLIYYDTDHQIIGLGNICCPVAHIKVSVTDLPLIYYLTSSSELGGEKLSRASHSLNFCRFCTTHIYLTGFLKTLAPKDLFYPTAFFGQTWTISKVAIIKTKSVHYHYFFLFCSFFRFFALSFSPLPFPSSKIFLSPKNLSFDAFSLKWLQISSGWFSKHWLDILPLP